MLLSGRIVWPDLFVARAFDEGSEPKYSCTLLLDKKDPKAAELLAVVKKLIKDELGGKAPDDRYMALKDGDASDNEDYHGNWELRCKNKNKPGVVDQNLEAIIDSDLIRGGDYVNIDCGVYAFTRKYKGIGLSLNNCQFVSRGEPIAGAVKRAEDVFTSIGPDTATGGKDDAADFLNG